MEEKILDELKYLISYPEDFQARITGKNHQ